MTLSRLATSALYEKYTPSGIAGYGGWASVTATTGSPETGTYNDGTVDWIYYKWTGSGSVTLTAGVVDVLVVGGGGGGFSYGGLGGKVRYGLHNLSASTHTITIGAGGSGGAQGSSPYNYGGPSSLGPIYTGYTAVGYDPFSWAALGSETAVVSAITGTSVTYGKSNQVSAVANLGEGGHGSGAGGSDTAGSSGVVIIRVPVNPELWGAPPAQGVLPNLGVGWASVTAASGTFTKGSYTDSDGQWTYWKFTASSSSLTTTAGLVDALLVGGGSYTSTTYDGQGGRVLTGIQSLSSGTHAITIGPGGTSGSTKGEQTLLGSVFVGPQGPMGGGGAGTGAGGIIGTDSKLGLASSITGSSVEYAGVIAGAPAANTGQASYSDTNYNGGSGVVIVRVPTAFDLT